MKTAIVTGGAQGLGRALSDNLLARGWHVVILDLPGPMMDECRKIENLSAYPCDLTDEVGLAEVAQKIIATRPSIDLVIYNAGITQIGNFKDASRAGHRKLFEVNYFAAISCAHHFLDPLRKSKGIHLAISSVAGFTPLKNRTAYAASKHALEGFFKSLRSEEKPYGVTTLIAAPSFVATNIGRLEEQPDGTGRPGAADDAVDTMTPRDAADAIMKGVDQRKPMILVGRISRLSWWISRVSPKLYQWLMERKISNE